jgi:hypothetical protein
MYNDGETKYITNVFRRTYLKVAYKIRKTIEN